MPNLVIDLEATKEELLECLSSSRTRNNFPIFSKAFFDRILTEWNETGEEFRNWFDREYQVMTKIPISTSKWSIFEQAKKYIFSVFFEMKHYFSKITQDWPLRLAYMKVTPLEFLQRQSSVKTFCPCCLKFSKDLVSGGEPPDRKGLVQYKTYFYWLCDDHIEQFLKSPVKYVPAYGKFAVPTELPSRIMDLKNLPANVAEDELCVVCYKHSRTHNKGNLSYAIKYNDKIFLFDSEVCMKTFMRKPQEYQFEILFKSPGHYPSLHYRDLPVLGMLEQYVAFPVIKALHYVTGRRPVIPGLTVSRSALICVGIFLKIRYAKIPPECKDLYMEGADLFHRRRKKLIKCLDSMKSSINPYLYYQEPMPGFKLMETKSTENSESVLDDSQDTKSKFFDEFV